MRFHSPQIGSVVLAACSVAVGFSLIVTGLFRIGAGGLWMVAVAVGMGLAAGGLVALARRRRVPTGFDLFVASSGLSEKEAATAWAGIREDLFTPPDPHEVRAATRALLVSIEDELRREEAVRKARRRPCRRTHLRQRSSASFRSVRRPDRTMIRQGMGSQLS